MPRLALVLWFVASNVAVSAPPSVTQFFSAGGQRGTTVEQQVTGAFERWPVQMWTSTPAIQAKTGEKGKLTLSIAADAVPPFTGSACTTAKALRSHAEVRDLTRHAGMRHVFRLAASLQEPEYVLKLATDRFTQKVGQPLEIDVTIEPRFGFKVAVELEVQGASVKVPTKLKDAKTLTLHLEPAKEPFSGPMRILGRTKGLSPRVASATVTDLERTTYELWLTVTK